MVNNSVAWHVVNGWNLPMKWVVSWIYEGSLHYPFIEFCSANSASFSMACSVLISGENSICCKYLHKYKLFHHTLSRNFMYSELPLQTYTCITCLTTGHIILPQKTLHGRGWLTLNGIEWSWCYHNNNTAWPRALVPEIALLISLLGGGLAPPHGPWPTESPSILVASVGSSMTALDSTFLWHFSLKIRWWINQSMDWLPCPCLSLHFAV